MASSGKAEVWMVRWQDAWHSQADVSSADAKEHVSCPMVDVGFLAADTPEGITLATSRSEEVDGMRWISFIPRAMVVEVIKLRAFPKPRTAKISRKQEQPADEQPEERV